MSPSVYRNQHAIPVSPPPLLRPPGGGAGGRGGQKIPFLANAWGRVVSTQMTWGGEYRSSAPEGEGWCGKKMGGGEGWCGVERKGGGDRKEKMVRISLIDV